MLLLLGADFAWTQFYPNKATIIQIDLDPTHIGRRHPVTIGAVGNIKATLEALLPRLEQHEDGSFMTIHVERFHRDLASAKAETVSGPDAAISGTYLTKIINKHAAEDALFAADDGTPTVWMLRHIDTGGKRRTFASLLHGTMAGGMASAKPLAFGGGDLVPDAGRVRSAVMPPNALAIFKLVRLAAEEAGHVTCYRSFVGRIGKL
jgi:pyruvate dehydrogenase (quinone)